VLQVALGYLVDHDLNGEKMMVLLYLAPTHNSVSESCPMG
jgi:hypothetical protein